MTANRLGPRVGGFVACMLATLAATAAGQEAKPGPWSEAAWTLNAPAGQWFMTGRDYGLMRYSPLKQITTENVKNLKAAWSFSTGTLRGHEGNPLVVGNVMYVHTSLGTRTMAASRGATR